MASTSRAIRLVLAASAAMATCAAPASASWRQRFLPPDGGAAAVAVDGAGDVVAAGGLFSGEAAVAKLDGTTGEGIWSRVFGGTGSSYDALVSVAVDAAGDAVVGGTLWSATTDLAVLKFAGTDGTELWRTVVDTGYDDLRAVAVDASGDVFAAGGFWIANTTRDVVILKLDGATGTELWRYVISAAATSSNFARDVAVDGAGDVLAAGLFADALGAVKLDGATGAEIWRQSLGGGEATAVAVGGTGDLVVSAALAAPPYGSAFGVLRLAGTTGVELWRYSTRGTSSFYDGAYDVALDAAGDVVATGRLVNRGTVYDIALVKLAGATGAELWRSVVSGSTDPYSYEYGVSVAVDAAGDVVTGVELGDRRGEAPATFKHAGGTGVQRWRQVSGGRTIALFPGGDAIAAASRELFRVSGPDGGIGAIAGRSLQVRDRTGDTTAELLVGLAIDPAITMPAPGSAGDPSVGGATVRLVNPITSESATITVPSGAGWTAVGNPPGSKGWRYRDLTGAGGACKSLLARPGKLKALCQGAQGTIPFSLDEPTQGALTFSVRLGSADPQCATFGGTVRRDQGAAGPGQTGYFLAAEAPAAAGTCP